MTTPNHRPSSRTPNLTLLYLRLTSGWALLGYWLALITATHWPMSIHLKRRLGGIALDNLAHGLLYLPLTWLLAGFWGNRPAGSWLKRHRLWLTPAALLAFGAVDEWTQAWVGRSPRLADWLGDAIGILLMTAILVVVAFVRRRPPEKKGLPLSPWERGRGEGG